MSELSEIKKMLAAHIDESGKQHLEMSKQMTRVETRQEFFVKNQEEHKQRLDSHAGEIKLLNKAKWANPLIWIGTLLGIKF